MLSARVVAHLADLPRAVHLEYSLLPLHVPAQNYAFGESPLTSLCS